MNSLKNTRVTKLLPLARSLEGGPFLIFFSNSLGFCIILYSDIIHTLYTFFLMITPLVVLWTITFWMFGVWRVLELLQSIVLLLLQNRTFKTWNLMPLISDNSTYNEYIIMPSWSSNKNVCRIYTGKFSKIPFVSKSIFQNMFFFSDMEITLAEILRFLYNIAIFVAVVKYIIYVIFYVNLDSSAEQNNAKIWWHDIGKPQKKIKILH